MPQARRRPRHVAALMWALGAGTGALATGQRGAARDLTGVVGRAGAYVTEHERARCNIGPIVRDFNVPTCALVFLRPAVQPWSAFEKVGEKQVEGVRAGRIRFAEQRAPSLVRDAQHHRDVPMRGGAWGDPAGGRVVRSVLETGGLLDDLRTRVEVRYAPDARLGPWVPVEMRERHESPRATVTGKATCRKLRRFETEVKLAVH